MTSLSIYLASMTQWLQITFHYIVLITVNCVSAPNPPKKILWNMLYIVRKSCLNYHIHAHLTKCHTGGIIPVYICLFVRRGVDQKPDMCFNFSLFCYRCFILYLLPVHFLTFFLKNAYLQIFANNITYVWMKEMPECNGS